MMSASAKVVSVDGNTVMIRPKGVNDELPFEAEELRINRVSAAPAAICSHPPHGGVVRVVFTTKIDVTD